MTRSRNSRKDQYATMARMLAKILDQHGAVMAEAMSRLDESLTSALCARDDIAREMRRYCTLVAEQKPARQAPKEEA